MEQNKIETHFKERLSSREIKPSAMAWEKLDSMLSAAEKPKTKLPWLYAAASFVGFVFIATFYFSQKGSVNQNEKNKVVIQNPIAPEKSIIPSKTIELRIKEKRSADKVVQQLASKNNTISVSKTDSVINKNNFNPNQVTAVSIINQKNEQESISSKTNAVTVDELLAGVNKSARLNNQTNPNLQVHVDPNQLLQQVDNDLEPTFRQSVFSKIADNVKVIKEAVVNRNKE